MISRFFILKLLYLLFCFTSVASVYGQDDVRQQKDSLWKAIENSEGEEKLSAYHNLFFWYMDNMTDDASFDSFSNFAKEYDEYAQKMGNTQVQGDIKINRLIACNQVNRFDEMEKHAPKTLEFLKKINMTEGYFVAYKQLITAYCSQSLFDRALKELQTVYKDAQQQNNNEAQFYMQYLMGMVYMYQDRLDEAESYYRMSIKIGEKMTPKPFGYIGVYLELCNMLQATKRYDDFFAAINQLESLIKEGEKEEPNRVFIRHKINSWILYANAYCGVGEYDKAEHYCDLIENMIGIDGDVLAFRALIWDSRGEYDKALDCISQAVLINPYHSYTRQNKIKILSHLENAPLTYAETEATFQFIDSVRTSNFNAQLDELRTQYEVDKITAEKERNHNYFLFALGGCVLLAIALGIWINRNRTILKKNRGLYRQIKEQDRLAEELEAMTKQYEEVSQLIPSASDDDIAVETRCIASLPGNKQQRQLVSRLRDYLLKDKYFATYDIDIQKLVPEMATNRTSLFEALKAVTGKTPMEYINYLRLNEAKRLLDHSDLTIETIALDCGFTTSSTFYRQFRERYRITPTVYRKFNGLELKIEN